MLLSPLRECRTSPWPHAEEVEAWRGPLGYSLAKLPLLQGSCVSSTGAEPQDEDSDRTRSTLLAVEVSSQAFRLKCREVGLQKKQNEMASFKGSAGLLTAREWFWLPLQAQPHSSLGLDEIPRIP